MEKMYAVPFMLWKPHIGSKSNRRQRMAQDPSLFPEFGGPRKSKESSSVIVSPRSCQSWILKLISLVVYRIFKLFIYVSERPTSKTTVQEHHYNFGWWRRRERRSTGKYIRSLWVRLNVLSRRTLLIQHRDQKASKTKPPQYPWCAPTIKAKICPFQTWYIQVSSTRSIRCTYRYTV